MRNVAAVGLIALLAGCAAKNGGAVTAVDSIEMRDLRLECSIQPVKSQFALGEPVLISVVVCNPSDRPVNAAFWGPGNDQPIVNFRTVGPSGEGTILSTKQALWCGTGVANVQIPPGREYRFSVDLLSIWEWGGVKHEFAPGSYCISAELFSETTQGSLPIVAKSTPVTFKIAKAR